MKMPAEMSVDEQIARVKAILITCGAAAIFAVLYKSRNFAELFDQSTLYMKMGGSYVLGLAAVAVLFTVIGFAVSAGWRLGKRLEKEEGREMCLDRSDAMFFGFFVAIIALHAFWETGFMNSLALPAIN